MRQRMDKHGNRYRTQKYSQVEYHRERIRKLPWALAWDDWATVKHSAVHVRFHTLLVRQGDGGERAGSGQAEDRNRITGRDAGYR